MCIFKTITYMYNVFWIMVLEKTLESSLDSKEIKPVNPKVNKPWIFIGRTDAEVEAPILWQSDVKNWLIWKDLDAGKDWRQGEKGVTEDEMVRWHHWLNGHEFEQAPGVADGQGGLVRCSSWGHRSQTWLGDWTTTTYVCAWLIHFIVYLKLTQRCKSIIS